MLESILAPSHFPFAVAIGIMLAIAMIEMLGLVLGFALGGAIDNAIPEFDADLDGVPDNAFFGVLSFFQFGKAPTLALLIVFLTSFGLAGVALQEVARNALGRPLALPIAATLAFVAGLVLMKVSGGLLTKLGVRDETSAIHSDSLAGHTATVTLGTARMGQPAQAKVRDAHGQTHYVLVEPIRETEEFGTGDRVTLIQREGARFYVVGDSPEALLSLDSPEFRERLRPKA